MKMFDKDLRIELSRATVLQIDKCARTGIFTDDRFFPLTTNPMFTNIIFQLKNSNNTLPLYIRDKQVPVYNKQEVDIIKANDFIIGYVDVAKEEYFYTTNDFCKIIGIKMPSTFIWIIGIAGAITVATVLQNSYAPLFAFMPLVFALLLHRIINFALNKKIENEIDEFMKSVSEF
jgi:hypothetical protein